MSQQPTTTPAPHPNGSPLNINRKTKMQAQVHATCHYYYRRQQGYSTDGLKTLFSAADTHLSRRRGPHFLPPLVHGSTLLVGNGKALLVHGGLGWLRLSTRGGGPLPSPPRSVSTGTHGDAYSSRMSNGKAGRAADMQCMAHACPHAHNSAHL